MGWEGDISKTEKFADRIADLAGLSSRVARKVSKDLEEAIQSEFDAGADPYGTAWKPLAEATKARGRTEPPLTDTHAMRDSLRVRPVSATRVEITIAHPARPHQTGWSGPQGKGPARPIVPVNEEAPKAWDEIIQSAFKAEIARVK